MKSKQKAKSNMDCEQFRKPTNRKSKRRQSNSESESSNLEQITRKPPKKKNIATRSKKMVDIQSTGGVNSDIKNGDSTKSGQTKSGQALLSRL